MTRYAAVVRREGRHFVVEYPDCPGCQTFTDRASDLVPMAREALEGWLEAELLAGRAPPRPSTRVVVRRGARRCDVEVSPRLSLTLALRWARQDAGLTQAELARRLRVSQQQIAKVEHPDANPTLDTLLRVAAELGVALRIEAGASIKQLARARGRARGRSDARCA